MSENHNTDSFAIVLDGNGGIKTTIDNLEKIDTSISPLWFHLDYKDEKSRSILQKLGLDNYIVDALCSPVIHQKFYQSDNPLGTFLILRGMNPNNISKSGDMTSLRIWIDGNKIITLCHNHSPSAALTIEKLKNNIGPKTVVECFINIAQASFHNISDITYKILEKVDRYEEKIIKDRDKFKFNKKISLLRRQIITIHRYILPQKEVFKNLPTSNPMFADKIYKNQFRDLFTDISRSIDNLEYCREHIIILKEELENTINISINNNMYILSVIIAIFTPLTLISGMLGMNLEGIPFADSKYAFGAVSLTMLIIALTLFWIVRRRKMI